MLNSFAHHLPARIGAYWIALLVLVALAGPWIRPDGSPNANDQRLERALMAPGSEWTQDDGTTSTHWLGTDRYGRDVLSRLMAGTAISLGVGFTSVLISLFIGILLGAWAGYRGGRIDAVISWFIQVVWTLPTLLMVLAITMAFGKGLWQVFLAIGLTMWVDVARVVRGQFFSLREHGICASRTRFGLLRHARHVAAHVAQRYRSHHRHRRRQFRRRHPH